MSTVKSAGSRSTFSWPCGSTEADVEGVAAAGDASDPQAVAAPAAATSTAAAVLRRRRSVPALTGVTAGVLVVGIAADDVERSVELDVHLTAVVEGPLDLVVALLVADLGSRPPAFPRLGECGLLCLLQGVAGDGPVRSLGAVVRAAPGGGHTRAGDHGPGEGDS